MTRSLTSLAAYAVLLGIIPSITMSAEFPFGHELLLEAAPMPGSKRLPSLEVETTGRAALDLWCATGQAQVTVAGETISIVPGVLAARPCAPERLGRDQELLTALAQATSWRREDDVVILIGARTLRFRLSTH